MLVGVELAVTYIWHKPNQYCRQTESSTEIQTRDLETHLYFDIHCHESNIVVVSFLHAGTYETNYSSHSHSNSSPPHQTHNKVCFISFPYVIISPGTCTRQFCPHQTLWWVFDLFYHKREMLLELSFGIAKCVVKSRIVMVLGSNWQQVQHKESAFCGSNSITTHV